MTTDTRLKAKDKKEARDLKADALRIANSIQIEGQTKAETKLIASGIQRGMELYLRQQSERARELDKRVKKVKQREQTIQKSEQADSASGQPLDPEAEFSLMSFLPWILLGVSWVLFALLG